MRIAQKIAPCLWFDDQAEAAAKFYTGIFRNSRIVKITRYGKAGQEVHGGKPGSVLTVAFELDGQPFTALNGGPVFKFNEAISLQVFCDTQEEVDYYWEQALRRRRAEGAAVRLAEGPVRRVVAGRAGRAHRDDRATRTRRGPSAPWRRC